MFFWKKQISFYDYFDRHSKEVKNAALLLVELFQENQLNQIEISKKIKAHEHEADAIVHEIVKQISQSGFILPLDREDILNFVNALDDTIDCMHHASVAYTRIYQINKPTSFAQQYAVLTDKGADLIISICNKIKEPSKHQKDLLKMCVEMHEIENKGDELANAALSNLFSQLQKNEIQTPHYIAWNDIYRDLERITDEIEDCANVVEQMVLKYA